MSRTHLKATHATHSQPKQHTNNINIFYVNVCRIQNKLDKIKLYLQQSKTIYHVIVIVETWLLENELGMFELDNYTSYNSIRKDRAGAGVTIYVINSLASNINYEFSDTNNNFMIIYLRKINIKIIAVYNTHNISFLEKLEEILAINKNCVILGDMNLDLLKNTVPVRTYKDIISSNGYNIINKIDKKYVTRIANDTKTIIDHAVRDLYNYNHHLIINSHDFTDHESLTLQININNYKITSNQIESKDIINVKNVVRHI